MANVSRRDFLRGGALGLAAAGAGYYLLHSDAGPTESSGGLGHYGVTSASAEEMDLPDARSAAGQPTEDNILGPFHRPGAPFRAKITPPLAAGIVLLVKGRVWGYDTKKPVAGAVIDIWQASAQGRYDNDDPQDPPAAGGFRNRARVMTDENGAYEFETVHPGRYKNGSEWRPAHVHYWVRHRRYRELITQLYFKGDPYNNADPFIKPSLIMPVSQRTIGAGSYELVNFDIVLAPL